MTRRSCIERVIISGDGKIKVIEGTLVLILPDVGLLADEVFVPDDEGLDEILGGLPGLLKKKKSGGRRKKKTPRSHTRRIAASWSGASCWFRASTSCWL